MKALKTKIVLMALTVICLTLISFGSFAQERVLQTERDGFKWYQLEQNGKVGAQSMGGTTFIPLSRGYTFISYFSTDGGWFAVRKNGQWGCCDITGRETVAPGRYDLVQYFNEDGYEYYIVKLNGKTGACDMNGREIISPKYDYLFFSADHEFKYENASGKWVSTGVKLEKNSSSSYASDNASNSSSSSSSSTTTTTTVTPTTTPQPQQQPIRQPQPMQVWKPCPYCQGTGQCQTCLGTGHTLVYPCQDRCWNCGGSGKCTHCAGQGGHNEIEYH